jgi:hypothetical protein
VHRAAVAVGGVEILRLAGHLPLRRDLLGSDTHAVGNRHILVAFEDRWIEARLIAAHRHHAHAFSSARDHHIRFAETNAIGSERDRLHA